MTVRTFMRTHLQPFLTILISVTMVLAISGPSRAESLTIGMFHSPDESGRRIVDEWTWALRGGGARVEAITNPERQLAEPTGPASIPMLIIDNRAIDASTADYLADWVRRGGLLLIAGPRAIQVSETPGNSINEPVTHLTGITASRIAPGLQGAYPRVVADTPWLSPFVSGDAIRLGQQGLGHEIRFEAFDAQVLARTALIRPGPGNLIHHGDTPTISLRNHGAGRVLFLGFSPGTIAACYPDTGGHPTDCSAAGTARTIMRTSAANLLWEGRGIQLPLPWETPGATTVGVIMTGDVHLDDDRYQIRAAIQMATELRTQKIPLTFFTVGDVAEQAARFFNELAAHDHVKIATHSAHGDQYRPGRIEGAGSVRADIRKAERMLGLASWSEARDWLAAIRTEAWASNETGAAAWTGMADAGIGLVFDHNADVLLPRPQWTAPDVWFRTPVHQRLFIPHFERSVTTANDHFRLEPEASRRIASLASPEPDPCCNHAVRFETYLDYVDAWHNQFRRIGTMGGVTEVWLWHPSTPAWKSGFEGVQELLESWSTDPDVEFFYGSEVATWHFNRQRTRIQPEYDDNRRIRRLELEIPDPARLAPLPPNASRGTRTVSYWVLGAATLPGWQTRTLQDPYGRTVTVASRELPLPETRSP